MKTIVIYFDADKKKRKQIIHPTEKWDGNAFTLVNAITRSDERHKGYNSFEIL